MEKELEQKSADEAAAQRPSHPHYTRSKSGQDKQTSREGAASESEDITLSEESAVPACSGRTPQPKQSVVKKSRRAPDAASLNMNSSVQAQAGSGQDSQPNAPGTLEDRNNRRALEQGDNNWRNGARSGWRPRNSWEQPSGRNLDQQGSRYSHEDEDRSYNRSHYVRSPGRHSPISSWKLSFSGRDHDFSAEEFLFRMEHLRRADGVSKAELLRKMHMLLKDRAEQWYWDRFLRQTPDPTWTDFRNQLISRFGRKDSDRELMKALYEHKQGTDSVNEYFDRVSALHNRLMQPLPERDLVGILREGLNPKILRINFNEKFNTIDGLRDSCVQIERWLNNLDSTRRGRGLGVSELETMDLANKLQRMNLGEPPSSRDLEEVVRGAVTGKSFSCWNCSQPGHRFLECPVKERRLFCYRCGQPGVVAPRCPSCSKSGNLGESGRYVPSNRSQRIRDQTTLPPRNDTP